MSTVEETFSVVTCDRFTLDDNLVFCIDQCLFVVSSGKPLSHLVGEIPCKLPVPLTFLHLNYLLQGTPGNRPNGGSNLGVKSTRLCFSSSKYLLDQNSFYCTRIKVRQITLHSKPFLFEQSLEEDLSHG